MIRGTQLYPEKKHFWHNLGVYQMQAEDFSDAVKTFEKLIAMASKRVPPSYYYHLSFALYRLEKYADALEVVNKITGGQAVKTHHLQLELHCLIALERWKDCQNTVRRLIRLDPARAGNWDLLGRIALNGKDYTLACAAWEINNILDETGSHHRTVEQLYRVQSAWNEAARFQGGENHYIRAQSLFRAGQYKKALLALDKDQTRHMEKSCLRGRLLFALGRNDEAVDALLAVESLPHYFLEAQAKKNPPDPKQARRLKDALTARALRLAGQIYWMNRDWVRARDIFKKLELLPGRENMGKSLAACMQFYLDETGKHQELPKLYDPPLVMAHDE